MIEVARRYTFVGTHHVPDLPAPWNVPHSHNYTVEIVASIDTPADVVVDTDLIDRAWADIEPAHGDLDELYGAANTTVEAFAQRWLTVISAQMPEVTRVVVWEDDSRWGAASR